MKVERSLMAGWRMADPLLKPAPVLASMLFGPWRNTVAAWRSPCMAVRHTANTSATPENVGKPCRSKRSWHRPPPATSATYFQHGTR
jgi:hypothetical protein